MAGLSSHTYDTLPSERSFRLLGNLSVSRPDSQLTCSLHTFNLDSHPPYGCLSYTWESPILDHSGKLKSSDEHPKRIRIEGLGCIQILGNLSDALWQFSQMDVMSYIFVDALCINQHDLVEKSRQVPLMGEIYSGCSHLYIWLGKDTTGWDTVSWLHRCVDFGNDSATGESAGQGMTVTTDSNLSRQKLESIRSEVWQDYIDFIEQRTWFRRAWIFQEVALAQEVTVHCGPHSAPWTTFATFAAQLRSTSYAWSLLRQSRGRADDAIASEIVRLALAQACCRQGGPNSDGEPNLQHILFACHGAETPETRFRAFLIYLLETIRPMKAGDPRDKIYAILGILNKFLPHGMSPIITADYEKSVATVYSNTTFCSLTQSPALDMLNLVEDRSVRLRDDLPSWVPDFSARVGVIAIHGTWQFDATRGGPVPQKSLSLNNDRLCLQGGGFDRIVEVAPMGEHVPQRWIEDSDDSRLLRLLDELYQALHICLKIPLEPEHTCSRSRIAAQTLIMDDGDSIPEDDIDSRFYEFLIVPLAYGINKGGAAFELVLKRFETVLAEFQNAAGTSKLPTMAQARSLAQQYRIPRASRSDAARHRMREIEKGRDVYHSIYILAQSMRRLFRTERGVLGLGPPSMQVSDEIWLLERARVPYVLRRLQTHAGMPGESMVSFELIGQSYVHGHMHGEVFERGLLDHFEQLAIA